MSRDLIDAEVAARVVLMRDVELDPSDPFVTADDIAYAEYWNALTPKERVEELARVAAYGTEDSE